MVASGSRTMIAGLYPAVSLLRWHRAGFRSYGRWKSRPLGGRPQTETELRALIRQMSVENPPRGAPRIHGELLKLGFEVAQSSVAKYMVKRRGAPCQGWRTFPPGSANWCDQFTRHPGRISSPLRPCLSFR
jgi:hypothetical protein